MINLPGYGSAEYAHAFGSIGQPVRLARANGWLLQRAIPGTPFDDAVGCYPIFCCQDWRALADDLEQLTGLVSVSLVTDPFADHDETWLRSVFPDRMFVFKRHFIVNLDQFSESALPKHHQRNLRSSRRAVDVMRCDPPSAFADVWCSLYDNLIVRHGISGIARFSRECLQRQLQVPGLLACRAEANGHVIGMSLWMLHDDVAYYHLGAFSEPGYTLRAGYALFAWSLNHLKQAGIKHVTLGAGAGVESNPDDGLSRFKRGWASEQRPVYFCGRILEADKYTSLSATDGTPPHTYFPVYRRAAMARQSATGF